MQIACSFTGEKYDEQLNTRRSSKSLVRTLSGVVWFLAEFWRGIVFEHGVQSTGVYSKRQGRDRKKHAALRTFSQVIFSKENKLQQIALPSFINLQYRCGVGQNFAPMFSYCWGSLIINVCIPVVFGFSVSSWRHDLWTSINERQDVAQGEKGEKHSPVNMSKASDQRGSKQLLEFMESTSIHYPGYDLKGSRDVSHQSLKCPLWHATGCLSNPSQQNRKNGVLQMNLHNW